MDEVVRRVLEGEHGLKLGRRLGRGAFAEVYQAESAQGVPCAVKISLDPLDGSPGLQKELDNLSMVQTVTGHPHVVTLMDYWLIGGHLVTRWELATEGSLAEALARHVAAGSEGVPLDLLVRYIGEAAQGIEFLNAQGVYHRDVKPQNLLLFHGHVKLADLGLAKFAGASTASHTGSGTLGYLPPEAYEEHRLSRTVDLYSLAATYVKLRTGREPFGTNPVEVVERQKRGEPLLDGMAPAEAEWVRRALAFQPEERPQEGAVQWHRGLQAALHPPVVVSPPGPPQPPPPAPEPFVGRQRVLPGVDTLAEAVSAAAERTVLVLAPGKFTLSGPLVVTKSLALEAEEPGRSRVTASARGGVVQLSGNGRWLLRGLELVYGGKEGDVLTAAGGWVQIEGCTVRGGRRPEERGAGIRVAGRAEAIITGCRIQENDRGLVYGGGSSGLARGNTCTLNRRSGIGVFDQATPTLEQNQCTKNHEGIAYRGSSSGVARGNLCKGNSDSGIGVADQAAPTLEQNQCTKNGVGIAYQGSSSGVARGNICKGNQDSGIEVGDQAAPILEQNQCTENRAGIAYTGSSSGVARGNICTGNQGSGIGVGVRATPTLEQNQCKKNSMGIPDTASSNEGTVKSGAIIGAILGASVGAIGGASVGAIPGAILGAIPGAIFGAIGGASDSAIVGAIVGAPVGAIVGAIVRAIIWAIVGAIIWAIVGAIRGAIVGAIAGASDAAIVGASGGAIGGASGGAILGFLIGKYISIFVTDFFFIGRSNVVPILGVIGAILGAIVRMRGRRSLPRSS